MGIGSISNSTARVGVVFCCGFQSPMGIGSISNLAGQHQHRKWRMVSIPNGDRLYLELLHEAPKDWFLVGFNPQWG